MTLHKKTRLWWQHYSRFVHSAMGLQTRQDEGDVAYWRELSFIKIVLYLIPLGLLALVPRMILLLAEGEIQIPIADATFYLVLCMCLLHRKIPARIKKVIMMVMFYLFSIMMLLLQGVSSAGVLYLTSASTFTVFLVQGSRIYYSLLANAIIYVALGLVIHEELFYTPLLKQFSTTSWFSYISTVIFINMITLILVDRVILRLEKIIVRESELMGELQDEALEVEYLNNKLRESEDYYRYLFASNPSPMWVFDNQSLRFLQVNDAALKLYGYSREEFMNMTIQDIRPPEEGESIARLLRMYKKSPHSFKGAMIHMKKNRKRFHVEVRSNRIEVNGIAGRLVLAMDITERVKYVSSIEEQNNRLKEIAWIQSHKVRAPLARVMSLSRLLTMVDEEEERKEILSYLTISAEELNGIITMIIKQAEEE